jgi:hypothetical protein
LLVSGLLVACAREHDIVARALVPSDAAPDAQAVGDTKDAGVCASVSVPIRSVSRKVDLLLGVDGSISMKDEIERVSMRVSDFALRLYAEGTDLRLIVIARAASDARGICIPAPLGSGDCTADDSNPPAYLHVPAQVSGLVLSAMIDDDDLYAAYAPMLRVDSDKHVVVITDASGTRSAERWNELILARDPRFSGYRFHAVVPSDASCGSVGELYPALAALRGGVVSDLCTGDFAPVFEAVASRVVSTSARCEWPLPEPPAGQKVEIGRLNVDVRDERGATRRVGYVPSREACARTDDGEGWYFDDPSAPSMMQACPVTCEALEALSFGEVAIELGCETQQAVLI